MEQLRTLVGGGTSVVGSSGGASIKGIVRNLDEDEVAHYINGYDLKYSATTVDGYDQNDSDYFNGKLDDEELGAVMNPLLKGSTAQLAQMITCLTLEWPGQEWSLCMRQTRLTQLAQMKAEAPPFSGHPDQIWTSMPLPPKPILR